MQEESHTIREVPGKKPNHNHNHVRSLLTSVREMRAKGGCPKAQSALCSFEAYTLGQVSLIKGKLVALRMAGLKGW